MVIVYSGRQDFPSNARAFYLTSFETQSSSCELIRVSGRFICLLDLNLTKSDFLLSGNLLSGNAIVSCNVLLCRAQLVSVCLFVCFFFAGC